MATGTPPTVETFAELLEQLGDVPLDRIRMRPPPGTATEEDVVAAWRAPRKRLCELVDRVLVEKAMGTKEGLLGGLIVHLLWDYLEDKDVGLAFGADGPFRLIPGLVRLPDASYISWERVPGHELSDAPIADLVPDLAVEVLSAGNTKKEMQRKLRDYFLAGVRLVWLVEPKTQTAEVYTSPEDVRRVGKNQALDGGAVLPGFTLPLKELFARGRRKSGRR
jgi:Uma2 family endonuclease